jgi:hypothetical protein
MSGPVPRNRSARAAALGNPATSRLESAVGNCFPGLEWDVRALDGRFFPGLLFWVVAEPLLPEPGAPPEQAGVLLRGLDHLRDPMLPETSPEPWIQALLSAYGGDTGIALSSGRWYLHWIEQDGHRIACTGADGTPLDGELVWRFIRSIAPRLPLRIGLVNRDAPDPAAAPVVLEGYRRIYTDGQGVIDAAYPPGELTSAMCIPWQHDFRDCACYYWATNHPDVVLAEGHGVLPDNAPSGDFEALTRVDWLRRDRGPAGNVAAPPTRGQARPLQIDHFEINRRWQDLAFVVGGREIGEVWQPPAAEVARRYGSRAAMVDDLRNRLAPMEYALACRYLYALFSLKGPDEAPADRWPTMADDLHAARQSLTLVAVGEMTHLRWVNQLLWRLQGDGYVPVLGSVAQGGGLDGPLSVLDGPTLKACMEIERPGGDIDRAYARCVVELSDAQYPPELRELAVRIDTDGVSHFERFRELRDRLALYGTGPDAPYLRNIRLGTPQEAAAALEPLRRLRVCLQQAYLAEAAAQPAQAEVAIAQARLAMDALRDAAEQLARQGIGVPFFDVHG